MKFKNYIQHTARTFTLAATLVSTTLLTSLVATPAAADIRIPGQMCQPANLTQALNFGLGWSQFGVRNNSATNSFFVVCPVMFDDDTDNVTQWKVEAVFQSAFTGNVVCTVFEIDAQNPQFGAGAVESTQNITIANPNAGVYPREVFTTVVPQAPFGNAYSEDTVSIVCALQPGTGIEGIFVTGS